MATVEVLTKARMEAIEQEAITDARLDGPDLILIKNNLTEINVGSVKGDDGPTHTFPGCVLTTTSSQGSAPDAWWNISWHSELRDTDGFHTGTSDVITIPQTGWYHLCGAIAWDSNNVGPRLVRYSINGAGDNRLAGLGAEGIGARNFLAPFAQDIYLESGDLLRLSALQDSGDTLAVAAGSKITLRFLSTT